MDSSVADSTLILQQPLQVEVCAVHLDDAISSAAVEVKQPIVSEHMSSSIYLESNAIDNDFINSNWLSCGDHSQKSNQRSCLLFKSLACISLSYLSYDVYLIPTFYNSKWTMEKLVAFSV